MEASPTDLLGEWTLHRTIEDRSNHEHLRVVGTSELVLDDEGRVRWTETGTLTRGDQDVPVQRTLFVEPRDDGWFVTFDDGRDFHPWSPGTEVVHPCAPDTYVGRVEVHDDAHWSVEWVVTGPAKDYTMVSELRRR